MQLLIQVRIYELRQKKSNQTVVGREAFEGIVEQGGKAHEGDREGPFGHHSTTDINL